MNARPDNQTVIEEVIEQLQSGKTMPDEVMEIFGEEADDHLRTIYDGLRRLENDSNNRAALADVRRAAHTLKGAAGSVGMQAATKLSHRMEDLLDRLTEQEQVVTEPQLNLLVATADQLQCLTTADYEVNLVSLQIMDLHKRFSKELESEIVCGIPDNITGSLVSAKPLDDCSTQTQSVLETKTSTGQVSVDQSSETSGSLTQYLRVPLDRLDKLGGLLGEMIVNRSEFHQRLNDFESRIQDMQNAMERLRNVARRVENQSEKPNHAGTGLPCVSTIKNQIYRDDFDQLEFEQFDDFYVLEQTLSEADKDAEIMSGEFRSVKSAFDMLLRRQQQLNRDAQKSVMRIRMVPLSGIKSRLELTVRSVAGKLGRPVKLEIVGEAIELDKTVLDAITDPILHLIRNAIDHGIEDSSVRKATGKPETALLKIEAANEGTKIKLQVIDDGAGLNLDKICKKAVDKGLIETDHQLTSDEIHSLIFVPGFSTAAQLTDVSGRGVGMDVVADAISRLKGSIGVKSEAGVGTTFTIELPTMLGVTQALLVETQGETFAIAMPSIQKIARLNPETVAQDNGEWVTNFEDRNIRLFNLGNCLHLENEAQMAFGRVAPMLIFDHYADEFAITVDSLLGCQDIVVKSMGDHLKNVPGYCGATIGCNGAVIPILDIAKIIKPDETNMLLARRRPDFSAPIVRKNVAMVIDDSISVRRVTEKLLKFAGWSVVSAKDGIDALEKLAELATPPDVFLCDMEMPRMDGPQFIRQIREQSEFEQTPVVVITRRASEKHRHKAFEAGATEFIVKPFNDEQLLELITRLVQTSRETVLA